MSRCCQLTVLGTSAAYPEPGRACSGFLLETRSAAVLVDAGYGTFGRLLAHRPRADVDAVVVTHEHPDHCIDLHALFRAHRYGSRPVRRIPLFCPPGVLDRLAGIEPDVDLEDVFDVRPLPGSYAVGEVQLGSMPLPHMVDDVGVRLETEGVSIAYTGDTAPVSDLAVLGRDTDLFVVEATDRPGETSAATRGLMTADEAGQWAAAAGAKHLVLTHFWPGTDRRASVAAARRHFAGPVTAAEEGMVLTQLPSGVWRTSVA